MGVHQSVQCLRPFRQGSQIAVLKRLREGIEQTPDIPLMKLLMAGFSPFSQHYGYQPIGACADIRGSNDQIMRFPVIEIGIPVSVDPRILIVPFIKQLTDCPADNHGQITANEPGVFSDKFNLTRKG